MPSEYNNNGQHLVDNAVPFESAQAAWFWFIEAQAARDEGVRVTAGMGQYPRPCEPVDILKIVDRLYRARRLIRDHLLVLRHYGRRRMEPDPRRVKEIRADHLWREALDIIEEALVQKGIVERTCSAPHENWYENAIVLETRKYEGYVHDKYR